jgi:hypothetical protein
MAKFLLPLFFLLLEIPRRDFSRFHGWCPNVDCRCNVCDIQSLIVVIPDPILRENIFENLLDALDGMIDVHFLDDTTLFRLSDIYYKIWKMKSKTLDAFVHDDIHLNELRNSLHHLMSLTSNSHNSQSPNLQCKLFLINSTVSDIRPYDLLRHSFPCTRSVLLKTSKNRMLNGYIKKFLPNTHFLSTAKEIQEIDWLGFWSQDQPTSMPAEKSKEC